MNEHSNPLMRIYAVNARRNSLCGYISAAAEKRSMFLSNKEMDEK